MGRTDSEANFWCDELGYEYQMANITASLITAQVERIEELVKIKRRIWERYNFNLKDCKDLKLLKENNWIIDAEYNIAEFILYELL